MSDNEILIYKFQQFWLRNNLTPSDTSICNIASLVFNEQMVTRGFNVWIMSQQEKEREIFLLKESFRGSTAMSGNMIADLEQKIRLLKTNLNLLIDSNKITTEI